MLDSLLTVLLLGATMSAIYALIALGFTMVFGVGGVLNLAHGGLIMVGAYTYLVVSRSGALDWLPGAGPEVASLLVAALVAALVSYVLYVGLVRYIEENVVITFLATVIVALLLTEVALYQFGSQPNTLRAIWGGATNLESVGTRVLHMHVLGFVVSWVIIGGLWYYVKRTDEGRSILAASMSERGAQLTGVSLQKVKSRTWLIAGAFAGIAGVFLGATTQPASPNMWLNPLALAFIIVVIGGIGSIKGSVVAAYLIGYLEAFTIEVIGASYQGILSLVVLVAVLLVLPEGLYGREFVHE
ncbi:branched-chain amino acid ABC transporter permease [Haloterrigena alkaliphila]|uniref:Branched-chain amino acid ABC transporter permease n=1 Tax=Haloterrigena alkaliphila TaxID=2816475 RepID=A0A8A2VCG5_9EURY|nr:branched-chain amino acid ABC transporter permease [Haloterrigena alkaliphila]